MVSRRLKINERSFDLAIGFPASLKDWSPASIFDLAGSDSGRGDVAELKGVLDGMRKEDA